MMRPLGKTLLLICLSGGLFAFAEPIFEDSNEPERQPRKRTRTQSEEPRVLKTRKRPGQNDRNRKWRKKRRRRWADESNLNVEPAKFAGINTNSFSLLIHTPLISENTFDKRFAAYGGDFLFSGALMPLGETAYLHGELGIGFTVSRITAPPIIVDPITHIYFQIPFRLRLLFPVQTNKFTIEIIGGMHIRVLEYDSRDTADGGFFVVNGGIFNNLEGNIGIGMLYRLSDALKLRILAEYINLSVGIEF